MGKLLTRLPDSRLHNCERFGQQQNVRAAETLKSSHRPDGKMADMPKSTLIFRFWIDIWFYQGYVRAATPANFPSPRWENC